MQRMPQDYTRRILDGPGRCKREEVGHKMFSGINPFELSLKDEEDLPLMEESRGDRTL